MVTGIFTCYTHVYMKVLNCGYICQVAMDTEVYIYLGCIYGEYLSLLLSLCAYFSFVGMGYNEFSVGTLTTQRVARLDTYMRELMYATVYVVRILIFS